jgi:hypothetical protein
MPKQPADHRIAELKSIAAAVVEALEGGAVISSWEEKVLLECIASLQSTYSDWLAHQPVKDRTFPH